MANAIMLPYVMRYNLDYSRPQYTRVASAMGVDVSGMTGNDAAEAAICSVEKLVAELGLPRSLREAGVKLEDVPKMAKQAIRDVCQTGNPRPCSESDMAEIYRTAL